MRTQLDQLEASMAMKQAEMNTDLIDHLSLDEKNLLSRLNPEITELKEKLITCRTDRIEVSIVNTIGAIECCYLNKAVCSDLCAFSFSMKPEKRSLRLI